jgi:hypothetical protein
MLREQVRYRVGTAKAVGVPLASAFVTSFDLELEMALWSQPNAEPFILAMPVNVLIGTGPSRAASTCWVGCMVTPRRLPDPAAELAALRTPQDWFVLSSETNMRFGIPTSITGVTRDSFARFWMVLGVPMGDNVVRYRFASQIAAGTMFTVPRAQPVAPEHAGLVVNRRVDAGARDLLHWYGFDVVKDECESFHGDLEHYIEHLQAPHQRSRPDEECDIR